METFAASLAFCEENPPVTGRFPSQRPVTRSFDDLFVLCLNEKLIKQARRRWFETHLRLLWRHFNFPRDWTAIAHYSPAAGPLHITNSPQTRLLSRDSFWWSKYFKDLCARHLLLTIYHNFREQLTLPRLDWRGCMFYIELNAMSNTSHMCVKYSVDNPGSNIGDCFIGVR